MSKIDLIIDALLVAPPSVWSARMDEALFVARELKAELAKREPQVCCGDYEKCWKACTPRGRWLAEKELAKPEQEKPEWQELYKDEIKEILNDGEEWTGIEFAQAVSDLLREKNT
jgi:hypothetical protein